MNRTRTEAFDSLKTRQIVYQNPDGTFPPIDSICTIANNKGVAAWTSDISVNSVVASNGEFSILSASEIELSGGVLTYSGASGLMVNNRSVDMKGSLTFYSVGAIIPPNTINTTAIPVPGSYTGGVLAENGHIYCIPRDVSDGVFVINTHTNAIYTITIPNIFTGSSPKWFGGVYAHNGKVYGIPYNSSAFLVIDTATDTISAIVSAIAFSSAKWAGGVLAPNGRIYCIPYNANFVSILDPISGTRTSISGAGVGLAKWVGGVLASNGRIYCIPFNASSVMVIDTTTDTLSFIPTGISGSAKWSGGCLAANGKIYGMPFDASGVLVINPGLETIGPFISVPLFTAKWSGAVLGQNGYIYGIPATITTVMVLDPSINNWSAISIPPTAATAKFIGGVLSPSGGIYAIPNNYGSVLQITTGLPTLQPWMLSPEFNKF
jgi:hypothetical protein